MRSSWLWAAALLPLALGGLTWGCGSSGADPSSVTPVKTGKGGKGGSAGKGGKGGSGGQSEGGAAGEEGEGGDAGDGGGALAGTGGAGGQAAAGGAGGAGQGGAGAGGSAGGAGGAGGASGAGASGASSGAGGEAGGSAGSASGGNSSGASGNSGSGNSSGTGSAGTGPLPGCSGNENIDDDGDGYTEAEGDCNDCDPNANPGAIDIVTLNADGTVSETQADEDCDGAALMPGQDVCDQGLAIDDADPIKGAFAMDICKVATEKSWGIIKAEYVKIDGSGLPAAGHIGHGLLTKFGGATTPKRGASMLALSSGTARAPGDPGFQSPDGAHHSGGASFPPGFPLESPDCGGVKTGPPQDSVALRLTLRAPSNAKSFSFKFKFFTFEYPGYICDIFNDFFTVLMDPPPADVNAVNKNITFDSKKNPVSVNNAFLEVCSPGKHGGKSFACPEGTGALGGTGFEGHGATAWLITQVPVEPKSVFTLTIGAFDSGDQDLDSTGIIDDFQWSAEPAQGTSTGKP